MKYAISSDELKEIHRIMWGSGDYVRIADLVARDCVNLVDRLAITPGMTMLDVACGTGNTAIPAAGLGARVIGVDLTPGHFPTARSRAEQAGVDIDWREGDAEALEFADGTFERVTSTFGSQFAPRHDKVAHELARVCRPGGLIGLNNWTETGWAGRFQAILSSYFPPAQEFQSPAMKWGDPDYVRQLFRSYPVTIEATAETAFYDFPSAEHLVRFFETHFGPFIMARTAISPHSRWLDLRSDLVEMTDSFNVLPPEEGFLAEVGYLQVLIRKDQRT